MPIGRRSAVARSRLGAVFAGLDYIDRGAMEHAYGPADEVPDLIRGLVDPDPAVREESLDAMYGGIHHQGDVYDSTLAAVPFLLEALTTPDTPGRDGIAGWLASVADLTHWPDEDTLDEDRAEMLRYARRANARIVTVGPALLALAADPDPALRAEVPKLLVAIQGDLPGVADLFMARLVEEDEPTVSRALFDALGELPLDVEIGQLLTIAGAAPASTAVSALAAVARCDPDRVPLDGVVGLLERAYAEEAPPPEPAMHCSLRTT